MSTLEAEVATQETTTHDHEVMHIVCCWVSHAIRDGTDSGPFIAFCGELVSLEEYQPELPLPECPECAQVADSGSRTVCPLNGSKCPP